MGDGGKGAVPQKSGDLIAKTKKRSLDRKKRGNKEISPWSFNGKTNVEGTVVREVA